MEFLVIFLFFSGVVWVVWKTRASKRASHNADLDRAWRIVLNDPNYVHRRRYEERKRADEARARKEEGIH